MPGRKFTQANSSYRYGFNGKENDIEVKGEGNQQDYGLRIYDPRLGKFLSVDPLTEDYPWYTPYQFAGNDVIRNIDLDGGEPKPATTGKEVESQQATTTEEKIQGRSEIKYTVSQEWVFHEGGVNGSKSGWMKADQYFEEILKPLAKSNDKGDFLPKLEFAWSRKQNGQVDYMNMVENVGKYIKDNPTYDHWTKWLPIWGSYKQAELDFSVGKNGWGSVNTLMAISDVFLVKSILAAPYKAMLNKGAQKGLKNYFGIGMSHEYGASVARWKNLGLNMKGSKHHWLISQELMETYPILKPIGNQTWNLKSFSNHVSHTRWGHFKAYPSLGLGSIPGARIMYPITSTPNWFRLGVLPSYGGRSIEFGFR